MLSVISHKRSISGFTLIELAIVLVVIGLIITLGYGSWRMLVESREIAKTQSVLRQAKSCLMQRMYHSMQYPTYTGDLEADCDNMDPAKDVDACLCQSGMRDAWGNRIRYLDGIDDSDNTLAGENITARPYHLGSGSIQAVRPGGDSSVSIEGGRTVTGVAFVLLSKGRNREFDIPGFGQDDCFPDEELISNLDDCLNNDFTDNKDDQFLVITGREIRAKLQD